MKHIPVSFENAHGRQLAASLEMPVNRKPHTFALFAHCFTCSKDILAAKRISQRLASAGIAVLRFDFTGLGSSDGEFANTDFTSNVGDLVKAAEHMAEMGQPVSLLVGHSLGGAAVLKAACTSGTVEKKYISGV